MTSHVFDFVHLTWVGHGPNQAQMAGEYLMGYTLCCWPPDHCSLLQDCRFLALFQADLRIFGTQTSHLAGLVASPQHLGGTWADFGTPGSITKESLS